MACAPYSPCCAGEVSLLHTSLTPDWWFLQSRWISGYQPEYERRVWPSMHWGFGSSSETEP